MSDLTALLPELSLPPASFRTRTHQGKAEIYDDIRQKYVRLTPEEWVRQHFVRFLLDEKGTPRGLVAIEMGFRYQAMRRRADVVVYDRMGHPMMMVECKAPEVDIRQAAFDQVAQYNTVVHARYLVVTNGMVHYSCAIDHEGRDYRFLDTLPTYAAMLAA